MNEQPKQRNWIVYTEGVTKRADRMYISLSRNGEFLLNRIAVEALGSPAAVLMMFEPETRTIGLMPVEPSNPHSFKMCEMKCGAKLVSSRGFMRRNSITLPEGCIRVNFPTARIEQRALVLELELAMPVVSKRMTGSEPDTAGL
jgi:hypothetical protein